MAESHGAAESGGCARGFVTSSNPSAWPWQRWLHHSYDRVHTKYGAPRSQTTATRARRRRGSYEMKCTAKFQKTLLPQAFFQLYAEGGTVGGSADCLCLCPWGSCILCSWRRSSRFSPRTGFSQVAARCRADLGHSSPGLWRWWCTWRSSGLSRKTEFNSIGRGADR